MTTEIGTTGTPGAGRIRALIIDHDGFLAGMVAGYLKQQHFVVEVVSGEKDALNAARDNDPDVVVLDFVRPRADGPEICRKLRSFSNAHVVIVAAGGIAVGDAIGLSVDADDYITEPFSPRELVARIRTILRRSPRQRGEKSCQHRDCRGRTEPPRIFGALNIDIAARQAVLDSEPINLTRIEFEMLAMLSSRPGVVFTHRQLLEGVWGESWSGCNDVVGVHIRHLRRKLGEDPRRPRYVTTARGIGYRLGFSS
ncbi:Response regulator, two-component system [uncultured Mycobacterium sp.]|uniref:PhoR family transcriptional regulator n=2 Tax=Mycobacteriaceae TaxID=1762 RepID=A0A064CBU2_9MYCO|nr:response regulator transcription factor [Mycolicibacterium aromaticivorans]KDE97151.1 PhoR family transcriptional regulator [Mycolicibacterium aromaticivorans JS19b1 = JCM 16368]SBS77546.1 Response regulator, two-component system [uncultured Mycobacterium sp.]